MEWAEKHKEEAEALLKRVLYAGEDGAEGTAEGDAHVFAVIDVDPKTAKAYVIFEYQSNESIDVFWLKVKNVIINKETNEPRFRMSLGIEKNGIGIAHTRKAKEQKVS